VWRAYVFGFAELPGGSAAVYPLPPPPPRTPPRVPFDQPLTGRRSTTLRDCERTTPPPPPFLFFFLHATSQYIILYYIYIYIICVHRRLGPYSVTVPRAIFSLVFIHSRYFIFFIFFWRDERSRRINRNYECVYARCVAFVISIVIVSRPLRQLFLRRWPTGSRIGRKVSRTFAHVGNRLRARARLSRFLWSMILLFYRQSFKSNVSPVASPKISHRKLKIYKIIPSINVFSRK